MAHFEKNGRAACAQLFSHYDRQKEHFGNENIDPERTHLNYNLAADQQQLRQGDFVRERCAQVRVQNRKDVNVMCSWIVTVPKDLPTADHKKFFEEAYGFLQNRYGKENVISSWVHMDEITPHMHYAFVPVVEDHRRGGFKLCAKEAVTRVDLRAFHQDLENHMKGVFGYEIGILNDATREGNKSIMELKRQTATERLEGAAVQAAEIVSQAHEEAEAIKASVLPMQAQYEAQRAYVDQIKHDCEPAVMYPEYAKQHKLSKTVTVPAEMWEGKHVAANELGYIKKARDTLEARIEEFKKTASAGYIKGLKQEINGLKREIGDVRGDLYEAQNEISRLRKVEQDLDRLQDKIDKTLQRMPDKDAATKFVQAWQTLDRSRSGPVR